MVECTLEMPTTEEFAICWEQDISIYVGVGIGTMHTVILGSALLRGMCLIHGSSQKKVLSVNRSRIMQSTVSCLMAHTMLSDIMAYYLNALVFCVWSVRNLSTS